MKNPGKFDRPIFVTGLPRSGTSLVTGLLSACGAWTGRTFEGGDLNPKGFFEHKIIRERILKPLLVKIGADPLGVRRLPPVELKGEIVLAAPGGKTIGLASLIRSVIEKEGYTPDLIWAYKDAKLSLLWPYFHAAFPHASWLVVRRNRESFVRSCLNTRFMVQHSSDPQFWKDFADAYDLRLGRLKSSVPQVNEMEIEKLFAGDFSDLRNFVERTGLVFDQSAVDEFIDRRHWHH